MSESKSEDIGAVLSNEGIVNNVLNGAVIIRPFNLTQVQPSSYDVRLGEFYYGRRSAGEFFCPWNAEHVQSYWDEEPSEATLVNDELSEKYGVPIGKKVILIGPGKTSLCHTDERIGGLKNITTMMKTRSSLGRCDVTVCRCAGWGDIGYISRWTMEITNNGDSTLVLVVGQRVAQIVFFTTTPTEDTYKGSYQPIEAPWTPKMMLPNLTLD